MEPEGDTQIADGASRLGHKSTGKNSVRNLQYGPRKRDPDEVELFDSGTLSEDDVLLIGHELGSSWKMVGRVLNVPDAVIDHIEANKSVVAEKCYSVLRRWKEMYPSDATYHRLALALNHPAVGREDLAVKYCGLQLGLDKSVLFKPGTVSEVDFLGLAHELGPLWKKLGLALKVPTTVIHQIDEDNFGVAHKCHAVLTSWRRRFPYDATYHCLARALKHPAVGRGDLATKYCGL